MGAELVKDEAKEMVLEFDENDVSVPELLASRLAGQDGVEFAGVTQDHPEVGRPRLVIKTEGKRAMTVLSKAIEDIDGDLEDLKAQLSKRK